MDAGEGRGVRRGRMAVCLSFCLCLLVLLSIATNLSLSVLSMSFFSLLSLSFISSVLSFSIPLFFASIHQSSTFLSCFQPFISLSFLLYHYLSVYLPALASINLPISPFSILLSIFHCYSPLSIYLLLHQYLSILLSHVSPYHPPYISFLHSDVDLIFSLLLPKHHYICLQQHPFISLSHLHIPLHLSLHLHPSLSVRVLAYVSILQ